MKYPSIILSSCHLVRSIEDVMRLQTRRHILMALLATVLALAACGPEDGRARGGGPGADGGNKPAQVLPRSKVFTGEDRP
jgi:hypothetical protein